MPGHVASAIEQAHVALPELGAEKRVVVPFAPGVLEVDAAEGAGRLLAAYSGPREGIVAIVGAEALETVGRVLDAVGWVRGAVVGADERVVAFAEVGNVEDEKVWVLRGGKGAKGVWTC